MLKMAKLLFIHMLLKLCGNTQKKTKIFINLNKNNKKIFQFVYATLKFILLKFYTFVEKRELDLRSNFRLKFKEWKDKKYLIREQQMNVFLKKSHHQRQFKKNL